MRAPVVVADVLIHQALQVTLIEHNDMIKEFSPAASYESLRDAVLPRTAKAGPLRFDPKTFDGTDDFCVEIASAVEDQVFGRDIVRKSLAHLLRDPRAARVSSDSGVQDAVPAMGDHEETVDHSKRQRGHGEEVHRSDRLAVVAQKCRPSLSQLRVSRRLPHPTQNGALRDNETEHFEFAVNPRCSPRVILGYHAEDEIAELIPDIPSSWSHRGPRAPCPVLFESGAMPADDGIGLNHNQRVLPG